MRKHSIPCLIFVILVVQAVVGFRHSAAAQSRQGTVTNEVGASRVQEKSSPTSALPGTTLLTRSITDDIREEQRQQIIRYFQLQIAATPAKRDAIWRPDYSSPNAYKSSIEEHRSRLREMLGITGISLRTPQIKTLEETSSLRVEDVTLATDSGFVARALIFIPKSPSCAGSVLAIPPADLTREQFAGVLEGLKPSAWLTTLLARNIAVAIPITIERRDDHSICQLAGGKDRRRVLWRAGFIVGRTMVGMEVQQAMAVREYLAGKVELALKPMAIMGKGQGGMTALYAAAVDEHFTSVASLDYFQQRERCWQEPVDRVLYGQLNEFGDAELAALIAPRNLFVGSSTNDVMLLTGARTEFARARRFYQGLRADAKLTLLEPQKASPLDAGLKLAEQFSSAGNFRAPEIALQVPILQAEIARDRQFESWFQYLQGLISASSQVREQYWKLDSTAAADRPKKAEQLRAELAQMVGTIPIGKIPLSARTRLAAETDKFRAYDVILNVLPGVEAYGQLLVPRNADLAGHVRLSAMICQHGFDGSPRYVSGVGENLQANDHFYHRFGQRLAERGYVVFAPYLTVPEARHTDSLVHRADLVNPIVRLAAPLGMMRTSIEMAKLHRIVDFLQSLAFVNPDRIGYYGLSYGGYSAIWMPPLEPRLKLTIISAHFNDWQTMLTDTTRSGASYWTLPDEDFYNWRVLNRFVHTQMIAAMWPRPVCVEYGSEDQVTTAAWHERAWSEVSAFAESWDMRDKIVDDDFAGPHSIHGIGTFFFIDRWLRPERAAGRDYGCGTDDYCYQDVAASMHGYELAAKGGAVSATQLLDSDTKTLIRGRFYVSAESPLFTGMAFRLARNGNPGDLLVRFGSRLGAGDVGEARISSGSISAEGDQWYEAVLKRAIRLDPTKLYYFELRSESGRAPIDDYAVYGPQPLGGQDYPNAFGLSFHTLSRH